MLRNTQKRFNSVSAEINFQKGKDASKALVYISKSQLPINESVFRRRPAQGGTRRNGERQCCLGNLLGGQTTFWFEEKQVCFDRWEENSSI